MLLKKIIIGTANLSQKYGIESNTFNEKNDLIKIYKNFKKKNKNLLFDTAQAYGKSENIIGNIFVNKNINYITKIIITKKNKINYKSLKKKIFKSLSNLRTNKIDYLLLHDTKILGQKKKLKEIKKIFLQFKKEKLINKYGFSIYKIKELKKYYKNFNPDVVQLPLNIFDQSLYKSQWIKKLNKEKKEIHARSIFLQGILLKKKKNLPKKLKKFKNHFTFWFSWLKENNISNLDACLNFINSQKLISKFIIGLENYNQFRQVLNFRKSSKKLNFEKLATSNIQIIDPRKWH
jgi:aryl-alcohol dehydrogenase-like predicted oxidoreductase